jgi:hypothetical protein
MKTIITILTTVLFTASLLGQNPVDLKLNLEKGHTYFIKSNSKQSIQQTVNSQQFSMEINSNMSISFEVLGQEKDVLNLKFKLDTIKTVMSSPMGKKETNSAKLVNKDDPAERLLNKMSSGFIIAKISTSGKFIGFSNYQEFKTNVILVLDSVPASKRDDAKKIADGMLRESTLKSMIEPHFAYLPEKPVKVGESWETTFMNSADRMSMMLFNSFTLNSVEGNSAKITGSTEIESMPPTDPNPQMVSNLKGKSTSTIALDTKTGLIQSNESKGKVEGTMTVKNQGNDMVIQMAVDSQTQSSMSK